MYNYYSYDPRVAQPQTPWFPWPWPPGPQMMIDSGTALKTRPGKLRIQFSQNFSRPPVVVVSPYWRGQGSQVGYVETVDSVSRNGFTVVSDNAANNYYVNWIAFSQD